MRERVMGCGYGKGQVAGVGEGMGARDIGVRGGCQKNGAVSHPFVALFYSTAHLETVLKSQ